MAWVVADLCRGPRGTFLVLSEEVTGLGIKNLSWPASLPSTINHLAGVALEVLGVRLEVTTTSTPGNRSFTLEFNDTDIDLVEHVVPSAVVAASLSRAVEFHPAHRISDVNELAGTTIRSGLPRGAFIFPGRQITILDSNVIDSTDTMIVHVRARVTERGRER